MNPLAQSLYYAWRSSLGDNHRVSDNKENLYRLAQIMSKEVPIIPDWKIPGVLPEDDLLCVNHEFYHCACNFSTTYFEYPNEKFEMDGFKGSRAIGRAFFREYGEKAIRAEEILEITESSEKMAEFFRSRRLPPLLEERRLNLREVAANLLELFQGDILSLLENNRFQVGDRWNRANGGALFGMEIAFPKAFGGDGKFQKRARLFLMMYQARALQAESKLRPLVDAEEIGPVIDLNIINTLRHHAVLQYSRDSEDRINNREVFEEDSEDFFLSRVAANYVVIELQRIINENKPTALQWNSIAIDHWLWSQSCSCHQPLFCKTTAC